MFARLINVYSDMELYGQYMVIWNYMVNSLYTADNYIIIRGMTFVDQHSVAASVPR